LNQNGRFFGGNVTTRWTRNFANGADVQVQAYYDRTDHWEPNFAETRNTLDVDFVSHMPAGSRHNITWGAESRVSPSDTTEVVSGLVFIPKDRVDQLYSAFIQDEIGIVPNRLLLTVGSKLLYTNFTKFGSEPSVRLLWAPNERQALWTAATHALRTPSRAEADMQLLGFIGISNGLPFFGRFTGNKDFQPEQLNAHELGYRNTLRSNLSIDLATFYDHYHNLLGQDITGSIFTENTPGPPHLILPGQFINLVRGGVKGVEVAPDWKPVDSWRMTGAYSYLHMNLTQPAGSRDIVTSRVTAASSPQHEVVARSSVDLPKQLEFNAVLRYVSSLPAQGVPSYTTADANVVWHAGRNVDLSFVGQNLFQPQHAEFGGDLGGPVGIRRSVYARATWTN
jgi:iron complex outermembrane receptor protein